MHKTTELSRACGEMLNRNVEINVMLWFSAQGLGENANRNVEVARKKEKKALALACVCVFCWVGCWFLSLGKFVFNHRLTPVVDRPSALVRQCRKKNS